MGAATAANVGKAEFPAKAQALFKPAPYKVFHGGRGATKTWDFTRAALILGARRKLFIPCLREIQKSIRDSVHKLLSEQIVALRLDRFYDVQDQRIAGKNDTEFVFHGIRNNITAIKSMEAIDLALIFEATFVSQRSWEILLPTVRRDPPFGPFGLGSEVWTEYNPELATDYTHAFWVGDPPGGIEPLPDFNDPAAVAEWINVPTTKTIVVECNWRDNPWFPETLERQRLDTLNRDPDGYLTIWEGKTRKVLQGAIYARELLAATNEGRIHPRIHYDPSVPVNVSFDLGKSDMCAMWFWQQIGMEHHAIDFYGNCGFGFEHYLKEIQDRKYLIGKIYLPHDASHDVQAAPKTIAAQAREAYPGDGRVIVVPRIPNITLGINAVRNLFPRLYFNEVKCADGLTALQHYQYEVDSETKERSIRPLHNFASNPADALRTYCEAMSKPVAKKLEPQDEMGYGGKQSKSRGQSWMG